MIDFVADARGMIDGDLDKETVTYKPDGGSDRQVVVLIDRNPPEIDFALPGGSGKSVRRVTLLNHATEGVAAPQFGKDEMEFKDHLHDSSDSTFRVTQLVSQDPGVLVVDVVK